LTVLKFQSLITELLTTYAKCLIVDYNRSIE